MKLWVHAIHREKNGKWKFRLESNGSPDTIQREVLVFKGDAIATVPDPDLEISGEGGWGRSSRPLDKRG